jgi:hypothetical protein
MSHVSTVKLAVKSLTALEAAAKACGAVFQKASTYKWFGRSVGDYPLPEGFKAHDLGKCIAKISVPNVGYEIGVAPARKKSGEIIPGEYVLLYDHWGPGQGLVQHFGGRELPRLKQAYAVETVKELARKKGYILNKTVKPDGRVVLTINR